MECGCKILEEKCTGTVPLCGQSENKEYHYEGKAYPMGQHGFARDMEFAVDVQMATEAWFSLRSNEETKEKYPFEFI